MKDRIYVFNPPQIFGGGEVFLVRLAKLLEIESRYVVVSPALPLLQDELQRVGGRFIELLGTGGIAIRLAFLAWLWRHRKEVRGSAVSFILNGRGATYFAPLVRLVVGISPVAICHTELPSSTASAKDLLYGAALRFARCSIAVSDTVEAQIRQRWPSLCTRTIPNWIEDVSAERQPVSSGAASPVAQIAVVGRLAGNKGLEVLADVFANMGGIEANFYGDGPLRAYLDNIASTAPWLRIHGHVLDLPSRLPSHALLVSGSHSESFSYSVAEGIYAGLLCVVSDIPAHRELLGPEYPEALYFQPGDVGGLRTALDAARQLLHERAGYRAQEAVRQVHLRMQIRNAPAEARKAYSAVLLDNAGNATEGQERVLSNGATDIANDKTLV